jgi:hypothetical protein
MFRLPLENYRIGDVIKGTFELDPLIPLKPCSLLSFDISCILVLNKELVDCRQLLPLYEQPRLVGQFSLAKNFHLLYKSVPHLYNKLSEGESKILEFAFIPPELSFPSIRDSLVLRINWFINVKLLPEGTLWTKNIDILPNGDRFLPLANLVGGRSREENESFIYVKSRDQKSSKSPFDQIQYIEDVVFALAPLKNPISRHSPQGGERIFDIKNEDQPFCKIKNTNGHFTITFSNPTAVLSILMRLFTVETINSKYSTSKDELVLKNVCKTKEIRRLKHTREVSFEMPNLHSTFNFEVDGFWKLEKQVLFIFALAGETNFECQIPIK